MHATVSAKHFGFGGLKSVLMATAFAAGIAVGVAGPVALNHAQTLHRGGHAAAGPHVYAGFHDPNLGEQRSVQQTTAAIALLKAYPSVGQGEGWLGGNRDILGAALKAYASAGMGEGWVANGRPAVALPVAHISDGAGEGWFENGRP